MCVGARGWILNSLVYQFMSVLLEGLSSAVAAPTVTSCSLLVLNLAQLAVWYRRAATHGGKQKAQSHIPS